MELLQRVAASRGQLLRVERLESAAEQTAPVFVLTFDVGRVLVASESSDGQLGLVYIEGPDAVPGGLVPADEEEPWWRVIGSPLTEVSPVRDGLALQFRSEGDNPRSISLVGERGRVRVALDPPTPAAVKPS